MGDKHLFSDAFRSEEKFIADLVRDMFESIIQADVILICANFVYVIKVG